MHLAGSHPGRRHDLVAGQRGRPARSPGGAPAKDRVVEEVGGEVSHQPGMALDERRLQQPDRPLQRDQLGQVLTRKVLPRSVLARGVRSTAGAGTSPLVALPDGTDHRLGDTRKIGRHKGPLARLTDGRGHAPILLGGNRIGQTSHPITRVDHACESSHHRQPRQAPVMTPGGGGRRHTACLAE
ncbi:hypothetical protein ADJ73_03560 [Arsenicicoccus sp. oral taxon 190]|nr:hypothetical protein ADJ73_03560 [Arsenicicoccus sp. oral taxon 190]